MGRLVFRYYPNLPSSEAEKTEKRILKVSLILPVIFVIFSWLVKISELVLEVPVYKFGVYPRHQEGLAGILLSPFIHGDFSHLINNSVSFLILGTTLFFFYRNHAYKIFIINYILSGLFLWVIGRESWHIGASGVIYGMAAFLFLSGVFRKDARLLTISLVVTFLYGSLIWGLLPIDPRISWDGHLSGAFSGFLLALWYINQGPPRKKFSWEEEIEEEEDSEDEADNAYWNVPIEEPDETEKNN